MPILILLRAKSVPPHQRRPRRESFIRQRPGDRSASHPEKTERQRHESVGLQRPELRFVIPQAQPTTVPIAAIIETQAKSDGATATTATDSATPTTRHVTNGAIVALKSQTSTPNSRPATAVPPNATSPLTKPPTGLNISLIDELIWHTRASERLCTPWSLR